MEFDRWMREADQVLVGRIGVVSDDLPDAMWRDWFEDGFSPREAVECYFEEQGWDEEEF